MNFNAEVAETQSKTIHTSGQAQPDGKGCSEYAPVSIRKTDDGHYELMFQTGQRVVFETWENVIRNLPHLIDRNVSLGKSAAKIPKDPFVWMKSWLLAYDRGNGTQLANEVMDWVFVQPMQQ